jgi:hypothetical protein
LRESYDWLVLGDHPGALLCGALVAKLGLSVLALPFGRSFVPPRAKGGPLLDPESAYLIGLSDSMGYPGLLARCLQRIEVRVPQPSAASTPLLGPVVVTPSARVEFSGAIAEIDAALTREFGAECASRLGFLPALEASEGAFLQFWGGLPEMLTIARQPGAAVNTVENSVGNPVRDGQASAARSRPRRVGTPGTRTLDVLADVPRSNRHSRPWFAFGEMDFGAEARETFAGLWSALCAGDRERFRMRDLLTVFALSRTGGLWSGGAGEGIADLRAQLRTRAKELGVQFPSQVECQRVFIEGGRITGVQVSEQGPVIAVAGACVGTPLKHVAAITQVGGAQIFARMKTPPVPTGWRYTLAVSVPRALLKTADAAGPWLLYKEQGAPAIECELRSTPEGASLNLRTVLPFEAATLEAEYQRLLAARMFRQVSEFIPGLLDLMDPALSPGPVLVPDFRRPAAPTPYGFASLAEIPDGLLVYDGAGTGSRSGVEGLFCVSSEAYPELGSLGGVVAAVEAAAWVAHRNGIVGPFA